MDESPHIPLSQDAALVVALAGTAMSFAYSAEDEAERWLRALRLHGQVGSALQALGVSEAPLATAAGGLDVRAGESATSGGTVEDVAARATELAAARGHQNVGTVDVLFAVMDIYGRLFDRALYLRGSSREELIERLSAIEQRTAARH